MYEFKKIISEEFSTQELLKFVNELSYYNRIQGSPELEKAAKYIKDTIEDCGLEVEIKNYNYHKSYGLLDPVVGWWVKYGELRLLKPHEKLLHSYHESRTVVAAHSPGGNVEGEVVYVGDGEDPKNYKMDLTGKIILGFGSPYVLYKRASEYGASGVLIYRRDSLDDAVPYRGLFLTPEEAKTAQIPAMVISRKNALILIKYIEKGIKPVVKLMVDAGFRHNAIIPVVTTYIGDSESEIHIYAHYCHPAGTINDNVSGAATIMELVLAISRAIKNKKLAEPNRHAIRFLWFPEYWGSVAYLTNETSSIIFSVNLDMIGEKQCITGSTLHYIKSPPSIFHIYEAIFYYFLKKELSDNPSFASADKSLSYKFSLSSYSMGSDHDIYLHFGIPSIMINQWPDKYYHSDLDTIDKFDANIARHIAISVGSAAYAVATNKNNLINNYIKAYFFEYLGDELSKTDTKLREQRINYLIKTLGNKILTHVKDKYLEALIHKTKRGETSIKKGKLYKYIRSPGIIPIRKLYKVIPWNDYKWINELISKNRFYRTLIFSLIPLYMKNAMTIREFKKLIENEFGVSIKLNVLRRVFLLMIKAKLMTEI